MILSQKQHKTTRIPDHFTRSTQWVQKHSTAHILQRRMTETPKKRGSGRCCPGFLGVVNSKHAEFQTANQFHYIFYNCYSCFQHLFYIVTLLYTVYMLEIGLNSREIGVRRLVLIDVTKLNEETDSRGLKKLETFSETTTSVVPPVNQRKAYLSVQNGGTVVKVESYGGEGRRFSLKT